MMTFVCIGSLAQNQQSHIRPNVLKSPLAVKVDAAAQQRAPRKAWGQTEQKMVLVEEDFSHFTEGSIDEPSAETIASYYDASKLFVDDALTNQPGWWGDEVYQAGGAALIKHRGGTSYQSVLNTPMGDYSGNLTISFRYRNVSEKTSYMMVSVGKGGLAAQLATNDMFYTNVPVGDDWNEVTLYLTNYSSDPDGFVQFGVAQGAVVIDDVKITSNYDFIASPVVKGVTDYANDSFTVEWSPVRKAADYRFYLYKQVYTSDEETVVINEDFENGKPADWNISETAAIAEGEGIDASKGLVLANNERLQLPNNGALYKNVVFNVKLVAPEGADLMMAGLELTTSADGVNFISYGTFTAQYYSEEFTTEDLEQQFAYYGGFADQFRSIALRASNMPEGAYFVIDNIQLTTGRPYELQPVKTNYYGYQIVNGTSYECAIDEPEAEYFYKVTAHLGLMESESEIMHAAGLAAPVANEPTDIDDRGGYTANWTASPKAQQYEVNNYGVFIADEALNDYVVLDEDFSLIDESITAATGFQDAEQLGNMTEEVSFDEYTKMPGWKGTANTWANGMLGGDLGYYVYSYLQTPPLYLANDDHFTIHVRLLGNAGYPIRIYFNDEMSMLTFDSQGVAEGTFEVALSSEAMVIKFTDDQYGGNFLLDEIKVTQNIKKSNRVFYFLGNDMTAETSYRFSGLGDYDFDIFAFKVRAMYEYNGEPVYSDFSNTQLFSLSGEPIDEPLPTEISSPTGVSGAVHQQANASFFNIAGQQTTASRRGINIIRMSDGSVRKVVTK